jgi:hypothetical protein
MLKKFKEYINEDINSKIKSSNLGWTVDGGCGIFAYTFKEVFPKANIMGILDKKYKPKPTMQHYFIEMDGKYFDGEGEKTIKEFESQYKGIAIKVDNDGFEKGKDEDDYSDLPDWGSDNSIKKSIEKLR